jgi:hypothetical protein
MRGRSYIKLRQVTAQEERILQSPTRKLHGFGEARSG